MLLQTVSHCLSSGWVVIYVPKGNNIGQDWMEDFANGQHGDYGELTHREI